MAITNITRRRVVQGTGVIGVASVLGTPVFAEEHDDNDVDNDIEPEGTAIRVAHASPDAPAVEVRATPVDETDEPDEENDENDTDDLEENPLVDELTFRAVSNYAEVDSGTYLVEVVTEDEDGFLEDIFEGFFDDDEETVLFEAELELEEDTTYTAVAFGELAEDDPEDLPKNGLNDENDLNNDEEDTDNELVDNENDDPENNDVDSGFQVAVLEDDLSAPAEEPVENDIDDEEEDDENDVLDDNDNDDDDLVDDEDEENDVEINDENDADLSRVRVFHAVPDVGTVSISQVPIDDEDAPDDNDDENDLNDDEESNDNGLFDDDPDEEEVDEEDDDILIEELAYGEEDSVTIPAGEYTLEVRPVDDLNDMEDEEDVDDDVEENEVDDDNDIDDENDDNGLFNDENDDENDVDDDEIENDIHQVEITTEGGVAYSGFALGYFSPAEDDVEPDDEMEDDENDMEDDNDLDDDNDLEDDDEDIDENDVEEPTDEEFELVVVEDSQDGERAEGGTEVEDEIEEDEENEEDEDDNFLNVPAAAN